MENIIYITDEQGVEHIIIDLGNNEFTSMTKAHYDAMQAKQSTLMVTDETSTL